MKIRKVKRKDFTSLYKVNLFLKENKDIKVISEINLNGKVRLIYSEMVETNTPFTH